MKCAHTYAISIVNFYILFFALVICSYLH